MRVDQGLRRYLSILLVHVEYGEGRFFFLYQIWWRSLTSNAVVITLKRDHSERASFKDRFSKFIDCPACCLGCFTDWIDEPHPSMQSMQSSDFADHILVIQLSLSVIAACFVAAMPWDVHFRFIPTAFIPPSPTHGRCKVKGSWGGKMVCSLALDPILVPKRSHCKLSTNQFRAKSTKDASRGLQFTWLTGSSPGGDPRVPEKWKPRASSFVGFLNGHAYRCLLNSTKETDILAARFSTIQWILTEFSKSDIGNLPAFGENCGTIITKSFESLELVPWAKPTEQRAKNTTPKWISK